MVGVVTLRSISAPIFEPQLSADASRSTLLYLDLPLRLPSPTAPPARLLTAPSPMPSFSAGEIKGQCGLPFGCVVQPFAQFPTLPLERPLNTNLGDVARCTECYA